MDFEAIITEAHSAATQAIIDKYRAGDREHPFNCGFAWVTVPGNSGLARHCRKQLPKTEIEKARDPDWRSKWSRYGDRGHRGWQWWKPGEWPSKEDVGETVYQQDVDFHYAAARAFATVLNERIPNLGAAASMRLD